tara:strand:+ start:129 stop:431 length:303 start_codon:yes stop_codon:yes gene_type:complete
MEETCQVAYQIYLNHTELIKSKNITKRRKSIVLFINSFYLRGDNLNYIDSTYLLTTLKYLCKNISFPEDDLYEIIIALSRINFIGINQEKLDEAMKELFR